MARRRVARIISSFVATALVAGACGGGGDADRDRNVDVVPTSGPVAAPMGIDVSFVERFSSTSTKGPGTTALWSEGSLRMSSLPKETPVSFTASTWAPQASTAELARINSYGGPSEVVYSASAKALYLIARPTFDSSKLGRQDPTRWFINRSLQSLQADDILEVDLDGDGQKETVANSTIYASESSVVLSGANDDAGVRERLVVADFTGDGRLDIARVGKSVIIFAQTATDLSFANGMRAQVYGVDDLLSEPNSVSAGDVNNDGKADIVVSGVVGTRVNDLTLLLRDDRRVGGFSTTSLTLPNGAEDIRRTQVVDLGGRDGNEILVDSFDAGTVIVPANFGPNNLEWHPVTSPDGLDARSSAAGDVNGDGINDIAFVDVLGRVYLRFGEQGGSWIRDGAAMLLAPGVVGTAAPVVQISDINNDGRNDVTVIRGTAVTNFISEPATSSSTLYLDDTHVFDTELNSAPKIEFGDFNNDGRRDMVTCAEFVDSPKRCLINIHSGNLANPYDARRRIPLDLRPMSGAFRDVALGDVTGDGHVDLIVAMSDTVLVYGNTRNGSRPFVSDYVDPRMSARGQPITSIAAGDVTGDGLVDVVVGFTEGVSVFAGITPRISPSTLFPSGLSSSETIVNTTTPIRFIDVVRLDGDQTSEIVGGSSGTTNRVLRTWKRSGNAWSSHATPPSFPSNTSSADMPPAFGDFDGDRVGDAAVLTSGGPSVDGVAKVYFAKGSGGGFALYSDQAKNVVGVLPAGATPFPLSGARAVDIDKDGKLDLVVAALSGGKVTLYAFSNTSANGVVSFARPTIVGALPFFATGAPGPHFVAGEFLNGDSFLDMVVVRDNSYHLMLSPMSSQPVAYERVEAEADLDGRQVDSLVRLDMFGDSRDEVVATSQRTQFAGLTAAAVLIPGSSPGTLQRYETLLGAQDRPIVHVAAGRLDADSTDDIVLSRSGYGLDKYLSGSVSKWGQNETLLSPVQVNDVAIGQLTPGGVGDIAFAGPGGQNEIYADKYFSSQKLSYLARVRGQRVAIADLNADGLGEIIALNDGALEIYPPNHVPSGVSGPPTRITLEAASSYSPFMAKLIVDDLNGDGVPDALASTGGQALVFVPGPLNSRSTRVVISRELYWMMTLADTNGDGLKDILVAPRPDTKIQTFVNTGDSARPFHAGRVTTSSYSSENVAGFTSFDANGDLLDDLVVGTAAMSPSQRGKLATYLASVAPRYGTTPSVAVSQVLSPVGLSIEKAKLEATASVPTGSSVTYEMTNNGTDWYRVSSGTEFVFPSVGSQLAWRVTLASTTGAVAPTVRRVAVFARGFVPPAAVASATATTGDGSLTVQWLPGPVASGGVVKQYKVVDAETNQVKCVTTEAMCVVSGLRNGKTYALRVIAENPAGAAVTEVTGQLTPTALPERLDPPVLTAADGALVATWIEKFNAATHAPPTGYVVRIPGTSFECVTTQRTPTSCTIRGLTNGAGYTAQVAARNVRGTGEFSGLATVVAPIGKPSINLVKASKITVSPTAGGFAVAAPNGLFETNGSALSEIRLLINGEVVCSTAATSDDQPCGTAIPELFVVSGLAKSGTGAGFTKDAEYRFSLVGVNEAGESEPTGEATMTYLGAITDFSTPVVAVGDGELTVSWTPPSNAGPNFRFVLARPAADACEVTGTDTTTCVVSGLTNGDLVTMNYTASNGFSTVSGTVSGMATPRPARMSNIDVRTDGSVVEVKWEEPYNVEAARVTAYEVSLSNDGGRCEVAASERSCTFDKVKRGSSYTVSGVAIGPAGRSAPVDRRILVATTPGAVMNLTTAIAETSVELRWDAPTDNGGAIITGFDVIFGERTLSTTSTSVTLSDLTAGQRYEVTVRAKNSTRNAGPGVTTSFTPMGIPDPPRIVGHRQIGSSIVLDVEMPQQNGGSAVVAYDCVVKRGSAEVVVETSCGLPNGYVVVDRGGASQGATIEIQVIARNSLLPSLTSNAIKVKLAGPPGGIGSSSLVSSEDGLSYVAAFGAPDDGGSPITGYELDVIDVVSGATLTRTTTTPDDRRFVIVPPLGVSVRVQIVAVNAIGAGPALVPFTSLLVYGPPSEPTITSAVAGDGEVYVEWDAPESTGGAPIESYTVEAVAETGEFLPSSVEINDGGRSAVFRGLENGVDYRMLVTASTAGGDTTATSQVVRPTGAPGAPIVRIDRVGDGFADISWTAPKKTGGSTIDSYVIATLPKGGTCDATGNACRLTGLINGVGYVVKIAVRTRWGVGPDALSQSFTPLATAVPDADVQNSTPDASPARITTPNLAAIFGGEASAAGGGAAAPTTVPAASNTAASTAPKLTVGQKVALRALVAAFKVKLPKGAVALLDVKTAASKPCAVTKRFVTGRSVGQCRFTILVQPKKGKAKRVNVNVEVVAAKGSAATTTS